MTSIKKNKNTNILTKQNQKLQSINEINKKDGRGLFYLSVRISILISLAYVRETRIEEKVRFFQKKIVTKNKK